ncbi:hypothetical protein [Mesorhizobium waimense]|uniref:hypothetical protein n=1 Tax=Mesorhizobium waimense TaxID=1300307 RepID=UPI001FDFF25B|nr:hypothetical protein [Mesorhizobium waimense]
MQERDTVRPAAAFPSPLSFPTCRAIFAFATMPLAGYQKQEAAEKKLPVMVRTETVAMADYAPRTSLTGVIAARTSPARQSHFCSCPRFM